MKKGKNDTIAAIATPLGEGGIGIVRISGPQALKVLTAVFASNGQSNKGPLLSHRVYHGSVIDPKTGDTLDDAIASYMKGPKSYTGEDSAEISCHGGIALLGAVLEAIIGAGARLAERGEFTKRAFLNGKIDLVQAEAVINLIRARTRPGISAAAGQLKGMLSREIIKARDGIAGLLAKIEASIDFPDDIEEPRGKKLSLALAQEKESLHKLLLTAEAGKTLKEGLPTVIIGKPNVGKSSLLNALLKEERAIVTELPGTTRDTIEEVVNVKGVPLRIIDTAGMRIAKDIAEGRSIERSKQALAEADLVLAVIDGSSPITDEDLHIFGLAKGRPTILVVNKIDKAEKKLAEEDRKKAEQALGAIESAKISALYGRGIKELEALILKQISAEKILDADGPIIMNIRHKESIFRACEALGRAADAAGRGTSPDLITIDLKEAVVALGEMTGEEVSEEIVERIFDEFCVGK